MNYSELIDYINTDEMNSTLLDIYLDKNNIEYQKERYITAINTFKDLFDVPADENGIEIYSAPGRTEVGGNHTDHQHGQVLAASINDDAIAVVRPTDSDTIRIKSEGYDMLTISLNDIDKKSSEEGTTLALVKGIIFKTREMGYKVGAFDAYITSDVLGGSGLSSSAAFETLIGNILSGLYNSMKIDPVTIAIIGQYAENIYFGKPCGLMDQMACSVGALCHINFADPSNPKIQRIDFDMDAAGYSLCITDTKGSHADLTPDYAAVPAEMKQIAAYFERQVLNDVPEADVMDNIAVLRKECGDRAVLRAIHFYEDNKRVERECVALQRGDVDTFLENVKASGNSSYKFLQNVFTTKDIRHQNVSVALCISELILGEDGGVCRVHGGGFAGTIQAFVKNEKVEEYKTALDKVFGSGACDVLKIRKYGGIKVI
ncbi:MAG: galactokinase [Eubacterium sp.]|nr:galactokinase [Eubacterium sp.]